MSTSVKPDGSKADNKENGKVETKESANTTSNGTTESTNGTTESTNENPFANMVIESADAIVYDELPFSKLFPDVALPEGFERMVKDREEFDAANAELATVLKRKDELASVIAAKRETIVAQEKKLAEAVLPVLATATKVKNVWLKGRIAWKGGKRLLIITNSARAFAVELNGNPDIIEAFSNMILPEAKIPEQAKEATIEYPQRPPSMLKAIIEQKGNQKIGRESALNGKTWRACYRQAVRENVKPESLTAEAWLEISTRAKEL